jgi:alpha-tubulin suppressor-like RCC1 family protein
VKRAISFVVAMVAMTSAARAATDPVRAVVLGDEHSCALRVSGTVACWGRNFSGQLGDGSREDRAEPVAVIGLDGVQQLAAFGARTCAVRRDGALLCWGHVEGIAGHARSPEGWDATTPRTVDGLGPIAEIALGADHACARDVHGGVRCWGKNDHGQLGDGTQRARSTPVRVAGLPAVKMLALGTSHSCALGDDGSVYCWGANEGGQVGDGSRHDRARATKLHDFAGTVQLVASGASTCARLGNGTARCWGWNSEGQLGDGTRQGHSVPKAVRGLEQAVEIALGATTGCARHGDGSVECWGEDAQIASEADDRRSLSPVARVDLPRVSALARAGQIAAAHQCVVEASALVRCWGKNDHGQLGGPSDQAPTRVRVTPQTLYGFGR